jgi:hypothetical protein
MKLIIALFALASVTYGIADHAEDYRINFAPIYGQNVCEYETEVDGAPVVMVGDMAGVKASPSQYGISADFVAFNFPLPVKRVGAYIVGPPGTRMICWGWLEYVENEATVSAYVTHEAWTTRAGLSGIGTPVSDEYYWEACMFTAPQPVTIYWVSITPYEVD